MLRSKTTNLHILKVPLAELSREQKVEVILEKARDKMERMGTPMDARMEAMVRRMIAARQLKALNADGAKGSRPAPTR